MRIGCIGSAISYGPVPPEQHPAPPGKPKNKKGKMYPAVALGLVAGAAIITVGATAAMMNGMGPSCSDAAGFFADGSEVMGDGLTWAGEVGLCMGDVGG